jgi:type IV fimbrial biogenesis protein FimT
LQIVNSAPKEIKMQKITSAARRQRGFTMVELMLVVGIVGIGAAMVMPDLSAFIRRGQISSGTNDLLAAVNIARTEAVKRSVPTVACASTTGVSCSGTATDWSNGYIVFSDVNGDGVRQAGTEELATVGEAFPPGITAQAFGGGGFVRFAPNGLMAGGSAGIRFEIKHPSTNKVDENRYVCVARAGRVNALNYVGFTTDARFTACGAL